VDRRKLTAEEEVLYSRVLESGLVSTDEIVCHPGDEAALQHLLDVGLLAIEPTTPGVVAAVDPTLAVDIQSSRVLQNVVRDLTWLSSLRQDASGLTRQYNAAQQSRNGLVEVVTGTPGIGQRLDVLLANCRKRMLTLHPEASRPAAILESVIGRDLDALRRGVEMRTLYLTPVRRQSAVQQYVDIVTSAGTQVRTLPDLPGRQLIIDDTAVVPYQGDVNSAVFVQDPSIVDVLVGLFEVLWKQAEDFQSRASDDEQSGATVLAVMRMLVDGKSTRQIARDLELSERMVTRLRAVVNERHGTDSAVRLGWLLRERFPDGIK
jgi:hypothetical protein